MLGPSREDYWNAKLRPIRLGAEPVEEQLHRRFLAMVLITGLTAMIGMILLAILAAFGRPDIGFRLFAAVLIPGTLWFWLDYALLRRRASAYLRENGRHGNEDAPPG